MEIVETTYADVIWIGRIPAPSPYSSFNPSQVLPSHIEIDTPPRCPNCKTELEKSLSFWGRYIWKYVGCGFSKRNKDSLYAKAERAEKIARRYWEENRDKFLKGQN